MNIVSYVQTLHVKRMLSIWLCLFLFFSGIKAAEAESTLSLPYIQPEPDTSSSFGIALTNTDLIGGLQIRFRYDAMTLRGFQIVDVGLTERATGFQAPDVQIATNDSDETEVLIVLYSLHGAAILPGEGDILTLSYQNTENAGGKSALAWEDVLISDMRFQAISAVSAIDGQITVSCPLQSPELLEEAAQLVAIPEPKTSLLIGLGLLIILALTRKKSVWTR